jgi:transposase
MVRIDRRKNKGRVYLYLEERAWIDGKSKRLWQRYLGPEDKFKELSKIALNTDIETETIEFGLIAALLIIARKLGIVEIINQFTKKREQGLSVGEHLVFAAINRCLEPVSKNQLKEWFESTVLKRIYPEVGSALNSRSYWTHYRYLEEEIVESIGDEINRALIHEFNVDFSNLLYDPTNFFTYINPKNPNQMLPRHGNCKDGRYTLNIINFSLFCALDGGIPLLHLVYPGNIPDVKHFTTALKRLKDRLNRIGTSVTTITLTFDKGNLSEDAFKLIDQDKIEYITSIRPSTRKALLFIPPEEFEMKTLPNGKELGVKEFNKETYEGFLKQLELKGIHMKKKKFETYGKPRCIIALYNPKQAKWQQENFDKKIKDRISKIDAYFKARLNNKEWSKPEKVFEKCQALLGAKKFQNVVTIEISGTEGNLTLSVSKNQEAYEAKRISFGKSFLMTSRVDLAAWEVAWAYRQQYIVENAFKMLKNPNWLSIRPAWVWTDPSIEGHSFVCFIGLLLLTLLVREVLLKDIPLSLPKVIKRLNSIKITKITIPGKQHPVYKLNKMNEEENALYNTLKLNQFI